MIKLDEKMTRIILLVMIALGIAGTVLTLAMKGGTGSAGPIGPGKPGGSGTEISARPVKTAPAFTGDVSRVIRVNGSLNAEETVTLYPDTSGKLVRNTVSVGDRVKAGQTVAWIDPSKPGDVYSASAVNATISGTVTEVAWNKGDTVSTADGIITIGKLDILLIETGVPERYSNRIYRGQTAVVTLEAFPGESFNAVVTEISPVLDPASRTLGVKLRLTTDDKRIKAGMFAAAALAVEKSDNTTLVPAAAVLIRGGDKALFVVEGGKAVLRTISTGLSDGDRTEILSGVTAGEDVIIEGQGVLNDGDTVLVQ